jgi:hypothetical protein
MVDVQVRLPAAEDEARRVMKLIDRAPAGDTSAVAELRKVLDRFPELWRESGDIARVAEGAWMRRMAGQNEFFRESVSREAKALRRELLGAEPTVLERLLVDRVVVNWLSLNYAETLYAQLGTELGFEQGTYYQERIDRCQKRHLSAIKALAQIRRLQVPCPVTAQVNVTIPAAPVPA